MKKLKILMDENKRLLGYCDFGEMEGSMDIEVEDDFVWRGNSMDYVLEEGKLVYSPDLAKIKSRKRDGFKKMRDEKIHENIVVEEALFQVRDQDLQKFFLKKIEADLNPELKEKKENWVLADNTVKSINFNDIEKVLKAFGERQRELFKTFGTLSVQLEKASSVEEIEKITWK